MSAEGTQDRRHAPSAERNTEPILAVLKQHLPASGRVLEIASGTGQHVVAFAGAFPGIEWWPSDPAADARASIAAWRHDAGLDTVRPPLDIDVTRPDWEHGLEGPFAAILAINLVHISPWPAAQGLLRGAAALLGPEGLLYLYGAYMRDGAHTAPSNIDFDAWLRGQDPRWGVRDMGDMEREAAAHGLRLTAVEPMPANNFSLVFRPAP